MNKRILIINTGGTLSSVMREDGLSPGISSTQMMEELRMVSGDTELSAIDIFSLDSANILPSHWARIAEKVWTLRKDYDGMVLIHGTDTLAYTSSMLSYMLPNINIPLVITGSQLSISHPVADALENLRCAIHMARSGCSGVFVAFNRKVILGTRASKISTMDFDAFESINYPDCAKISSLGMSINKTAIPKRNGVFRLENAYSDKVFMIKLFPGISPRILSNLKDEGYKGVYIEAFGLGGIPFIDDGFLNEVKALTETGIAVLVGTQCRYGGSNLNIYETGRKALDAGVIESYDMTAEAALTKLMWVLGKTQDPEEIREYFKVSLCNEVNIDFGGKGNEN